MASEGVKVGEYTIIYRKQLGSGSYSKVYLAKKSAAREGQVEEYAAIKEFWKKERRVDVHDSYKKELEILSTCDHPNIVKLLHHEVQDDHLYLVLFYCTKGNLEDYFQNETLIPLETRLIFCHDACQGLMYLHGKRIEHRDLKPENLLINQDNFGLSLLLGDVGVGRFLPDGKTNQQATQTAEKGTPSWMAPETYSQTQLARYNRQSDIFSLGLCLVAILTHKEGEKCMNPLEGI